MSEHDEKITLIVNNAIHTDLKINKMSWRTATTCAVFSLMTDLSI